MSNKLISMQTVRVIIQHLQKGFSQRSIARELKLSRNTVKHYVDKITATAYNLEQLSALSDSEIVPLIYSDSKQLQTDPRKTDFYERVAYFLSELKRTGVTRALLWQEYKQSYPEGYEYSKFCELLSEQKKVHSATMRFTYTPAEVVMIDFAGDKMGYVDPDTGEMTLCPVLVCVLPYSGYSYARALPNATIPQVVRALNECLAYFTGVPHTLKTDNMKQLVTRSCRYEPQFSEVLQQWALHNNIVLTAARVAKPKDKAPVENQVKLTYQRIYAPLRDRVFFSLSELNEAILKQLQLHHSACFQKKTFSRQEVFTREEQPLLQPLPMEPYTVRHQAQAKVQRNYHITLGEDWHHYSVPFRFIGKSVSVVYDSDLVEIYCGGQRIALPTRSYKEHDFTTTPEHMPEGHRCYRESRGWTPEYFVRQAQKVGPSTEAYVGEVLKGKRFTEQTYNACLGILRLARAYEPHRLEAACKRALQGRVYTYRTLQNILQNNLDTLEDAEQGNLFEVPLHDNLRGAEEYE
jgi:transposase